METRCEVRLEIAGEFWRLWLPKKGGNHFPPVIYAAQEEQQKSRERLNADLTALRAELTDTKGFYTARAGQEEFGITVKHANAKICLEAGEQCRTIIQRYADFINAVVYIEQVFPTWGIDDLFASGANPDIEPELLQMIRKSLHEGGVDTVETLCATTYGRLIHILPNPARADFVGFRLREIGLKLADE